MKIGFPNNPRKKILGEIEWIGENKFDFVDLFLEEDEAVPEKINVREIKRLLQKYGLDVIGHTAWYLPIGSPMKVLRDAAVREATRYFEIFNELEVTFVTIHANWSGGMFSVKERIRFQAETLRELIREASEYNLKLMYEPLDTLEDNIKNVSMILNEVPELFFHIDIGHANLFRRRPEQFIKKFHEKLRHVHLHDNMRDLDLHLPMGCGNIDWEKTIRVLKQYYDGTITLEIFSRDRDYVLLSKEKLTILWNEI
ncbi:MAG: sugar phosphate isomerase/epimerase family protein [Candidatus Bathyarchaeia archaeon]